MQNVTGSYKNSIAGLCCAFILLFFSFSSVANESSTSAVSSSPVAVNTEPVSDHSVSASATSVATAPVNTTKPSSTPTKASSASQLASLIGGLALILVLIYGLSWFVKRFSQGGFLQNPTMKIVSSMPLGTRERLMLVDVGGKQLLLGVTAAQINTLHVFEEPVAAAEKASPASSDFSQKLMAILQQKNFIPADDSANKKPNP